MIREWVRRCALLLLNGFLRTLKKLNKNAYLNYTNTIATDTNTHPADTHPAHTSTLGRRGEFAMSGMPGKGASSGEWRGVLVCEAIAEERWPLWEREGRGSAVRMSAVPVMTPMRDDVDMTVCG